MCNQECVSVWLLPRCDEGLNSVVRAKAAAPTACLVVLAPLSGLLVALCGYTITGALVGGLAAAALCAKVARDRSLGPGGWCLTSTFALVTLLPEKYLPVGITFGSLLRLTPLFAVLILGVGRQVLSARHLQLHRVELLLLISLYLGLALNLFFHHAPHQVYFYVNFIGMATLAYLAGRWLRYSATSAFRIARATSACLIVASVYGIVEFAARVNFLFDSFYPRTTLSSQARYFPGTEEYRLTSSLGHPLVAASVLGALALLVLGVARSRSLRGVITAVLVGIAILLTQSRSAIVLYPIFIAVVVSLAAPTISRRALRLLGVVVVLGAIALPTASLWSPRFSSATASTEARFEGYRYTRAVLGESLAVGLGVGTSNTKAGYSEARYRDTTPESAWLELFVDTGLLPALALVMLTVGGLVRVLRRRDHYEPAVGIFASLAFVATQSFFFNGFMTEPPVMVMLFALLGMAWGAPSRIRRELPAQSEQNSIAQSAA